MSEFDEEEKAIDSNTMPSPEKMREMLEQHAYESAKAFAQRGSEMGGGDWVNYGNLNGFQFKVIFEGRETPAAQAGRDLHLAWVSWRAQAEDVPDNQAWGGLYSEEDTMKSLPHTSVFLFDHTRPGTAASESKRGTIRRYREDLKPGDTASFGPIDPEELAHLDSMLTQLAN